MQELKSVKNTVEKEPERDSNSQKDNFLSCIFYGFKIVYKSPHRFCGLLFFINQVI